MLHVRRAVACCGALTVALFSLSSMAGATTTTTSAAAIAWLDAQQKSDGGFELSGFPGFETPDAVLAIAEQAQSGAAWSTTEALDAVGEVHYGGSGPTPLDALDAYAATIASGDPALRGGVAAKVIVLDAEPLGLDPAAFDPADDGSPTDLVALLDGGCSADTASFGTFNGTLFGVIAKRLLCGEAPAAALTTIRDGQQPDGGWNYLGTVDPNTTSDVDTTALALQALVAGGATSDDPAVVDALGYLATNQQADGAWQSFGTDDPNSTSAAILGITAAGFDPQGSAWRDVAGATASGVSTSAVGDPIAWLEAQQLDAPPADAGRIASPNDGYGVNTFATSQTVQALLRRWLPVVVAAAPVVPAVPVTPVAPVAEPAAVAPRFTG